MTLGVPIGYQWVNKEIKFSNLPNGQLGELYREAMQNKLVALMEESVDKTDYIAMAKSPKVGTFLWFLDKRDCRGPMAPYIKPIGLYDRSPQQIIQALGLSEEETKKLLEDLRKEVPAVDALLKFMEQERHP
jgi:hypothetical protein